MKIYPIEYKLLSIFFALALFVQSSAKASGQVQRNDRPSDAAVDQAFYVSPNGSDENSGTSKDEPFKSLERAQQAMRSSQIKSTYLLAGIYSRRAPLSLTTYLDANQSWLAYPRQSPILDGGSVTDTGIIFNVSHIRINGLTIQNFRKNGIEAINCRGNYITNNTILNLSSPDTEHAAICLHFNFSNSTVSNNLIQNNKGPGITLVAGSINENNSNVQITNNAIFDTNQGVKDTGAIYILDRGHVSKNLVLSGNKIVNYGKADSDTKAIYMDDQSSNALIEGNIVSGCGSYCLQLHGSNDITVRNNIFDITHSGKLALYQDAVAAGFQNYGMANNLFTQNIVYSSATFPSDLWDFLNQSKGTIALPTVERNMYWQASGMRPTITTTSTTGTTGAIQDRNLILGNPQFIDPARGRYEIKSSASRQIDFHPIDENKIGPFKQ